MASNPKDQAVSDLEAIIPILLRAVFWQAGKSPLSDLSLEQMRVMRILKANPHMRVTQLASELRMTPSAVTQMTNRLCSLGLVEREDTLGDARGRSLALSEKGLTQMEERRTQRIDHATKLLADVPTETLNALVASINEILSQVPSPSGAESLEFVQTLFESRTKPA